MDCFSAETRSKTMRSVHSQNTSTEIYVRKVLFSAGLRYRIHVKTLPGKPDIVLPKYKTVIEVRGCFWHRHPGCKEATTPSTHIEFWQKKFDGNVARDKKTEAELTALGWNYIAVWECELKRPGFLESLSAKIREYASNTLAPKTTPSSSKTDLHSMISRMNSDELLEAMQMMEKYLTVINSAEYKKFCE